MPNILILFFCIALFEDTGLHGAIGLLMDRIMHLIGLHGKSFIPMLMGFDATWRHQWRHALWKREGPHPHDPDYAVHVLFGQAAGLCRAGRGFFRGARRHVIFGLYLLGIVLSILNRPHLPLHPAQGRTLLVMELPPYRCPWQKV